MHDGGFDLDPISITVSSRSGGTDHLHHHRPWIGTMIVGSKAGTQVCQGAILHREIDSGNIFLGDLVVVQA